MKDIKKSDFYFMRLIMCLAYSVNERRFVKKPNKNQNQTQNQKKPPSFKSKM